ncbi:hypothetical protein D3C72_1844650 [compost metagenome]
MLLRALLGSAIASKTGFSIQRNHSSEISTMTTGIHNKNGSNQVLSGAMVRKRRMPKTVSKIGCSR